MLLLPIEVLQRESVDCELRVFGHPALDRSQRNLEQLGVEPGKRLSSLGKQDLNLLAAGVDRVVALILVVPEGCEVPDLVLELADLVPKLESREQLSRTAGEAPLKRRKRVD